MRGSMTTGRPAEASGRVQLRRMASATASRMDEALRCGHWLTYSRNSSRSSMVTRPPAPEPEMKAMSEALMPNSSMRAFIRGDM